MSDDERPQYERPESAPQNDDAPDGVGGGIRACMMGDVPTLSS